MKKVANSPVVAEPVTIRLHTPTLLKLDALAEQTNGTRTDVVRRALATYFRLSSAIIVPIDPKSRTCLVQSAHKKNKPAEMLAGELMKRAIKDEFDKTADEVLGASFRVRRGRPSEVNESLVIHYE